jgi:excisionase family DNA binding protein
MPADAMVSVDMAADRLGVSVATARRWLGSGKLTGRKVGKQWLIPEAAVASLLDQAIGTRFSALPVEIDLAASVTHLRARDLKEVWVPDALAFADYLNDIDAAVASAAARITGVLPLDPVTEIPVPKSSFFSRPAVLLSFEDRLAYHAVVRSLVNRADANTKSSVYSARVGSDKFLLRAGLPQWRLWRASVARQISDGKQWMIKTDVAGYYASIQHRLLLADVERLAPDPVALSALRRMLREWSVVPNIGLPEGPDASRLLANIYLHPVDEAMTDPRWTYTRYMDDFRIVAPSRRSAIEGLHVLEREVRRRGLLLSSAKTEMLTGFEAQLDLVDNELGAVQYAVDIGDAYAPRELARILMAAIAKDGQLDARHAKFSLWRLLELSDFESDRVVLEHLENLAPIAPVVVAYLSASPNRELIREEVGRFLQSSSRNTSSYLSCWLLALCIDLDLSDGALIDYARAVSRNRNQPTYHRALAMRIVGVAANRSDLEFLEATVKTEFDPAIVRAALVALHVGTSLGRDVRNVVRNRMPQLEATLEYLEARNSLPVLLTRTSRRNQTGHGLG